MAVDLLEEHGGGIVVKGREAAKHDIENHTHRPQINLYKIKNQSQARTKQAK